MAGHVHFGNSEKQYNVNVFSTVFAGSRQPKFIDFGPLRLHFIYLVQPTYGVSQSLGLRTYGAYYECDACFRRVRLLRNDIGKLSLGYRLQVRLPSQPRLRLLLVGKCEADQRKFAERRPQKRETEGDTGGGIYSLGSSECNGDVLRVKAQRH